MKKITILILILAISGCAGTNIISKEFRFENIVHYSQLDKLESTSTLNRYVAYLDKGDMFPKKSFGTKSKGGTISFGMGMSKKEGIWSYLDVKEAK
jgi:hypothetical protein